MPGTTTIKIPRVRSTCSQVSESSKTIHIRLFDPNFSVYFSIQSWVKVLFFEKESRNDVLQSLSW